MSTTITLPATLEDFTAYQERLICRKLSAAEQEVTAEWLEIFNDVSVGDLDGVTALSRINLIISRTTAPGLLRFLSAAREWIVYAWKGAH